MISDFIKKKTSRKKKKSDKLGSEEYIDLGELVEKKDFAMEADTLIKIAEIHRFEDVRDVVDEVYDGNILLVDTESIAGNKEAIKRVHEELKAAASDINGDIAGLGNNFVAVTPAGIGIDRNKIKPF
ncbi:MAG: cell division protein SepF [Candidatus Saliniplasma sp.]